MKFIRLIIGLSTTALMGCSTAYTLTGNTNTTTFESGETCKIPRVYSGVAYDAQIIRNGAEEWGIAVFAALDLPFSAVADTVLLPYTLVRQAEHGNFCDGTAEVDE